MTTRVTESGATAVFTVPPTVRETAAGVNEVYTNHNDGRLTAGGVTIVYTQTVLAPPSQTISAIFPPPYPLPPRATNPAAAFTPGYPMEVTWPAFPTGLTGIAQTGKTQLRGTTQVGRIWTEVFGPLNGTDPAALAWLAAATNLWQRQDLFDRAHPTQARMMLGTGSGTPAVAGSGQTGTSIATGGWTAGQTVLRAGDIIKLPGLTLVYDVTADVVADGSGNATIPINPPIWAGHSPTDAGAVTVNNPLGTVTYRVRIASFQVPQARADAWYVGATVAFAEVP